MDTPPDISPAAGQVNVTILQPPPLREAPPSYSATMRISLPIIPHSYDQTHVLLGHHTHLQASTPFYHPPPPPSYSETELFHVTYTSNLTTQWGREPQLVRCPGCSNIVMSMTREHCTRQNHIACIMLCLCACWPCCILPYFLSSCKEIQHVCPTCQRLLGVHNPWNVQQSW